jgi:uncharacterized surface protein with fasciclin (FAS1) repeats
MTMRLAIMRWGAAPLAALALTACGDKTNEAAAPAAGAAAPNSDTLAKAVSDSSDLSSFAAVVKTSRLDSVLDGVGPYTVLAPTDAAFGGASPPDAAAAAALLRAHMLPGLVTRADIDRALAADPDGKVEMRTMDERMITFSKSGDVITATAPGGVEARLTGRETVAKNGVVEPVDGLLVKAAG